jgi:hypothetical protein
MPELGEKHAHFSSLCGHVGQTRLPLAKVRPESRCLARHCCRLCLIEPPSPSRQSSNRLHQLLLTIVHLHSQSSATGSKPSLPPSQPPSSSMTTFTLAAVHPTSPEASKSVATRPLSFLPVPPLIAGPSGEFPPHQDHKMGASSPPPLDGALARMFSPSVELPAAALSAWHCGLECHRSGPDPMAISRASRPCGTMQRTPPPYRATSLAIGGMSRHIFLSCSCLPPRVSLASLPLMRRRSL